MIFLTRKIDQEILELSLCSTWSKCHLGQVDLDQAILTKYFTNQQHFDNDYIYYFKYFNNINNNIL